MKYGEYEQVNGAVVNSIIADLLSSLEETGEFNNFECYFGFRLGKCNNLSCLHCVVYRITQDHS